MYIYSIFFFRELAIQIAEHFEALGACIGVKCAVVSFWPKLVLNRHVTHYMSFLIIFVLLIFYLHYMMAQSFFISNRFRY